MNKNAESDTVAREIPTKMDLVLKMADENASLIEQLANALTTVLGGPIDLVESTKADTCVSPLGETLYRCAGVLHGSNENLDTLLKRLEL